jgi:hypothetical protein
LTRSQRSFLQLSPAEKRLILEASVYVAVTRVVNKLVPFRWIARTLERPRKAPQPAWETCTKTARSIGWAVAAVSRTRPLRAVCLPQAIAAHQMLKRRGIPSTLFLGVAHENSKMIAHAWVTVGNQIITGAAGHERFTVVSRLCSSQPEPVHL